MVQRLPTTFGRFHIHRQVFFYLFLANVLLQSTRTQRVFHSGVFRIIGRVDHAVFEIQLGRRIFKFHAPRSFVLPLHIFRKFFQA